MRFSLTTLLIAINVALYIYIAFLSDSLTDVNGKLLVAHGALFGPLVVEAQQWWRLFTAMFLHHNLTHILFNMVALYMIGQSVESILRKQDYLLLYIGSGLLGAMASLYMHPVSIVAGASGAIFGLFGVLVSVVLVNKERLGSRGAKMLKEFGVILALNIAIGFAFESVDLSAHVAGFFAGLVGGGLIALRQKNSSLVFILFVVLLLLLSNEVPHRYSMLAF